MVGLFTQSRNGHSAFSGVDGQATGQVLQGRRLGLEDPDAFTVGLAGVLPACRHQRIDGARSTPAPGADTTDWKSSSVGERPGPVSRTRLSCDRHGIENRSRECTEPGTFDSLARCLLRGQEHDHSPFRQIANPVVQDRSGSGAASDPDHASRRPGARPGNPARQPLRAVR